MTDHILNLLQVSVDQEKAVISIRVTPHPINPSQNLRNSF